MPPYVPLEQRQRIVELSLQGWSQRAICRLMNRSRAAVSRIIRTYRDHGGSLADRERSGRPRATDTQTNSLIVACVVVDPFIDAKEIRPWTTSSVHHDEPSAPKSSQAAVKALRSARRQRARRQKRPVPKNQEPVDRPMADSAPTHPEECSGGAVSSGAYCTSTDTACSSGCTVSGATCNFAGKRAEAVELLHWVNACLGTITYGKVQDLSSGAASAGRATGRRSYRHNLELVQWSKDLFYAPPITRVPLRYHRKPRVVTVPGGDVGAGDLSDTVEELASQVAMLKEALWWLELETSLQQAV
ncbi:hypothetical protein HPB50_008500 [Hyalomma asiaticum]|uniref:Uncharacterized protein n=1 Tax=Hyalomma asiaticum TaxID=266040 RepID=A0ACB7TGR0_HYAAI|nr:hypothetical protein HPB50_008500 [Hyalomma asiaticum]